MKRLNPWNGSLVRPLRVSEVRTFCLLALLLCPILDVAAQTTETYAFTNLSKSVPDGSASGMSDVRSVTSSIVALSAVRVKLQVVGEFNGDLYGYLRHVSPTQTNFCVLLNRPGRSDTSTAGYADAGFDITFDSAAANGDIHVYRTLTNPAPGAPLTGTWQPDGRNVDPSTVVTTNTRSTTLMSFNSAVGGGEWTLFLADLESGGTNMLVNWELQLSGVARPTVTWPTPSDIVYGTALSSTQLNASSPVAGTFTYTPATGTVLNAASNQTLSVTFAPSDTSSYTSVTTNVSINVLKAPLTVTAVNTNKVYGAPLPGLSASYSGFVNGDATNKFTTQPVLSTAATVASPVGTYPITAGGASSSNYTLAYVSGILAVTPASLTITALSTNKIYGAALPGFNASYSGFVNGDTSASLTTPVQLNTSATASSPVGSYAITASGASGSNYLFAFVSGTLTVTPASLTITALSTNKVYGAALPTFGASYSGFVNGDTPSSLATPVQLNTAATAASPVGSYPITASGASGSNYTIAYISGTLTVTPAALTVTAVSTNKLYGAALPGLSASYTGFVNGDTPGNLTTPAQLNTSATAASPVDTYPITASGATGSNYTIAFVGGTLTVTPTTLTITAVSTNKIFGAPVPALSATYAGFVNGDTPSSLTTPVQLNTSATATSPVGTYPITATNATGSNYAIVFVSGTLTVIAANTTGVLSSSVNPSLPGQLVTFTMTVSAIPPGAGTPNGSVQFKIDGANSGSPVPLSGGAASFSISALALGTHSITAEYPGSGNFTGTTNSLAPVQLVNTPPIAGSDTIERWPTNGVKVSITALLSNDSDADGDIIAFLTASSPSAHGGTVTISNGWVFYTPPNGFTNEDSFTYTISDGRGAPVTGTVTVAIKVDNAPSPNLTITDLGDGSYRIRFDGIPGLSYRIQYTTDVNNPNWQVLGTATANGSGMFEFIDRPPGGSLQRFYRSIYP